jgi:hypothetical protein
MSDRWAQLGQPDVETMLCEVASYDSQAAALAREVWARLPSEEQAQWREQIAAAVLSYRGPHHKSRIGQLATQRLERLARGE